LIMSKWATFQDFRSVFKNFGKYAFQIIIPPYHIQYDMIVCFSFRIFQCAQKRFHRGNQKWTCLWMSKIKISWGL
jgi:hypothetical protein